jgi:hypothetical protein
VERVRQSFSNPGLYDQRQVCRLPGHLCPPCDKRSGCRAQQVWLPGNDLQDPSTWVALPLCTLNCFTRTSFRPTTAFTRSSFQYYNCSDQPAAAQPTQPYAGGGASLATRAQTRSLNTQAPRTTAGVVPPPACSSSQDQPPNRSTPIPAQRRLTQQISTHWPQFKTLRQHYAGSPIRPGDRFYT